MEWQTDADSRVDIQLTPYERPENPELTFDILIPCSANQF